MLPKKYTNFNIYQMKYTESLATKEMKITGTMGTFSSSIRIAGMKKNNFWG